MTISFEPKLLDGVIELVIGSDNLQDLCRRIVHADFAKGRINGASIFEIDTTSNFRELVSYGVVSKELAENSSVWGPSLQAEAVRNKRMEMDSDQSCLPLIRDSVPTGCLVLAHNDGEGTAPFGEEVAGALAKLVAFFIDANRTKSNSNPSAGRLGGIEEMTTRQVQILALIAEGLTNAEIAGRILLSESTIRQETIRIYRALSVGNRHEAVAKGRALGLIQDIASTPQ